ncbi:MAG: N-acetylneuraminate synthase family protein [Treponema sp.]|jgi:sialic acid synthase SpsE|nr:N-acetylneuraminate synthase family protein [Treponema sp.]
MNEINKFQLQIDGLNYNPQKPLIIAELGTAHNGDIVKAKEMAASAAEAGAACIKFQLVYADEILHPNTGEVTLPGGRIRLYDRFKALEAPPEFYAEIKEYVESKGLLFLCTPFGLKSASILREIQPKVVKVASPELNFTSLLQEIAHWELPVLLSSGVSMLKDIEEAICIINKDREQIAENTSPVAQVCLLHCVTSYPAPETDYNLRVLPNLARIFGVSVGVSDHSSDPELVPALAVCMGATAIEKHFCLSRSDPGLDDPIALPPEDFARMARAIRRASENTPEKTIEELIRERGADLVKRILGNGIKTLAPSERENYTRTNRSIHALRDISAGETLKKCDYAVLRTEKNLRPGLEPRWEIPLEGRTVRQFIPAGEGIRFEDI